MLSFGILIFNACAIHKSTKMEAILIGNDLSNWNVPENNIWWTLDNGILNVKSDPTKTGSTLWTKKEYQNFVFETDFLMGDGTVDSGVFLRSERQQIQIGISGSLKKDMTGSIYIPQKAYPGKAENMDQILKPKEWNTMKIKAVGNLYTVWVNDQEVLNYESAESLSTGPIGLQLHPNTEMEISFKNIKVGELPLTSMKRKMKENRIQLIPNEDEKKVDVFVEGKFFTSYIYPNTIKKPVLYPLITPDGTKITRNYPLEPSIGERVDHPHHVGLWFNYGDVNGLDFWNNSDAIPEEKRAGYGTIVHRLVNGIHSGENEGRLEVTMDWVSPIGQVLLKENTTFVFKAQDKSYSIERITKLTAQNETVYFNDNKEGMIGIRVIRALEHPSTQPEIFTDANGNPTEVKIMNNEGVNGNYINAEGIEGKDCWGKRSNWVNLRSKVGKEDISLVILDHKSNVGYPTYWHARDYGLFAANPLGQKVFSGGKNELNFNLEKGESVVFKHEIIVASKTFNKAELDTKFETFSMN